MSPKKILLVDDCRITVLLMKHLLSKIDVHVDTVTNGSDGLERALKEPYPLVFTEVVLQGMSGFELCRRLQDERQETRVVLLTGLGERFRSSEATEVGASAVFFKPIVPSQIIDMVKGCLELEDETVIA